MRSPGHAYPSRRHVLIGTGVIAALMAWHAESSAHGNGNGAVATVTVSVPAEVDAHVRSDLDVRRNDNYGRQQVLMVGTSRGATGLPAGTPELQVFHAGTALDGSVLRSSGGRVLCVTALGDSVRQAQQQALAAVRQVRMDGAHWRNDIGHRAIKH